MLVFAAAFALPRHAEPSHQFFRYRLGEGKTCRFGQIWNSLTPPSTVTCWVFSLRRERVGREYR